MMKELNEYLYKKYDEENVHFVGLSDDIAKYQIHIDGKWINKKFKRDKKGGKQ